MRETERGLLLLCCQLGEQVQPLRPSEYAQLRARVEAASLAEPDAELTEASLHRLGFSLEQARRIMRLMERPNQPERYLDKAPNVTVLTRLSQGFPQRLRRLGGECPPALFCKGDVSFLQEPCVSLVGSRMISPRGRRFAQRIGKLAAREGFVLVSGNACGADQAAQDACLGAGGKVVSFIPNALWTLPQRENVLYISDEGYDRAFSAERALRRNHYIHALPEQTFVAQCPEKRGGTWAGTNDNLRRGLSSVYLLEERTEGTEALHQNGAVYVPDDLSSIAALRSEQLSIFD